MPKKITLEYLAAMSVHDRATMYKNACAKGHTPEGAELKALIERAGLPFSEEACLTSDDPITIRMHEVIHSKEGREAALKATKEGLPAMVGIDPLLQVALGVDYGPHNMGTQTAGDLVGKMMRSLGYKNGGKKKLPDHCVAKTAETWI